MGIIKNETGPRSWSEYRDKENDADEADQFDRRNVEPFPAYDCHPQPERH